MDPSVRRTPATFTWQGKEVRFFGYDRPFDSSRVIYLLDVLVLTLRFGGQGLAKTARATSIKKSGHPDVYKRAFASKSVYACLCFFVNREQWVYYIQKTRIWMS
jgi:hypothetical protein